MNFSSPACGLFISGAQMYIKNKGRSSDPWGNMEQNKDLDFFLFVCDVQNDGAATLRFRLAQLGYTTANQRVLLLLLIIITYYYCYYCYYY